MPPSSSTLHPDRIWRSPPASDWMAFEDGRSGSAYTTITLKAAKQFRSPVLTFSQFQLHRLGATHAHHREICSVYQFEVVRTIMSEIVEQAQTPALSEFPVAEIPAQCLEPKAPQPGGGSEDEAALSAEIVQLWRVHLDCQSAIKQETQQFRSLRSELGRLLHQMKGLLAKPGRAGGWSEYLRERGIPRATADRLVSKYERSLNPDGNCLTESICEPTEEGIRSLLDKIAPKLRRVLRTATSVYRFIDLMTTAFEVNRKDTEEGFIVLKPSAHMAVEQSVPDAKFEPVPVISDVQVEGDPESMRTSAVL